MIRSYKYRLYPRQDQVHTLNFLRLQSCNLYNSALLERCESWKMRHISLNYYDQANQLKFIRRDDPTGIGMLSFSACQRTLQRVDKTYRAFFRRIKQSQSGGFPRFKPYHRFRSLEFTFGGGATLKDNYLVVHNVGPIKIKWHRQLPSDAIIKVAVLTCDATCKWYVCFQIECPDITSPIHNGPAVGIDLGLSTLATLSTGEYIQSPKFFRQAERNLHRKQRHLSRCKRGSHRRKDAVRQVAKTHAKIANQRRDFNHKLSTRLIKEFSLIAVENLNISSMAKSTLAKSIYDAGWSMLLSFLSYKALIAGSKVIAVDPYNTSQACSSCGSIVKKDLSVRVHYCSNCGLILDRDHNAALNILHLALKQGGVLPSDINVKTLNSYIA